MFKKNTRTPGRVKAAGSNDNNRRDFDAQMASLRAMRRLRCAARNVPLPPIEEAA